MGHSRKGSARVRPGQMKRNWWAPDLIIQWPCKLAAGGLRNGVCAMPLRKLCAPQLLRNWGFAMENFPTERGAQTPRNALKQFMKNQGAHWSHVSTVF